MKVTFLSILFCGCIFLSSCATPVTKYREAVQQVDDRESEAVYATNDSIHAGRFDLAEKYSDQSVRLVTPPIKRIPIQDFTVKQ